jgi:hypothetical protein
MGQTFPLNVHPFRAKGATLLHWACELNHSSVASENWHSKGYLLKIGKNI